MCTIVGLTALKNMSAADNGDQTPFLWVEGPDRQTMVSETRALLTRVDVLRLLGRGQLVVADAEPAVDLVEQGGAQVGELGLGDLGVRVQPVVPQQLRQLQTLQEEMEQHNQSLLWLWSYWAHSACSTVIAYS